MTESTATLRTRDAIQAGHRARAEAMEAFLSNVLPWRAARRH